MAFQRFRDDNKFRVAVEMAEAVNYTSWSFQSMSFRRSRLRARDVGRSRASTRSIPCQGLNMGRTRLLEELLSNTGISVRTVVKGVLFVMCFSLQVWQAMLNSHHLDYMPTCIAMHGYPLIFDGWNEGRISLNMLCFSLCQITLFIPTVLYSLFSPGVDPLHYHLRSAFQASWVASVLNPVRLVTPPCLEERCGATCARMPDLIHTAVYLLAFQLFVNAILKRVQLVQHAWHDAEADNCSSFYPVLYCLTSVSDISELIRRIIIFSNTALVFVLFICLVRMEESEYKNAWLLAWAFWDVVTLFIVSAMVLVVRKGMHLVSCEELDQVEGSEHALGQGSWQGNTFLLPGGTVSRSSPFVAEVRWAFRTLKTMDRALRFPCVIYACVMCGHVFLDALSILNFRKHLVKMCVIHGDNFGPLVNAYLLIFSVGVFSEERPELKTQSSSSSQASCLLVQDWSEQVCYTDSQKQMRLEKIQNLASRSIAADDILDFYARLEEQMIFDPLRSTTNDVVRQAIIPLSKGTSYAQMVAKDNQPQAKCMVTHTWSNLFLFLVAAILADATGEKKGYRRIATLLMQRRWNDISTLLTKKRVAKQTYWVCIFCVNQHTCTCDQPYGHDSVTMEEFPPCACKHEKYLNGHPKCEIEGFDQVMALLHAAEPAFHQVVAVDQDYALFTRVWCVAEILQAFNNNMSQSVQLLSFDDFDSNSLERGDLRIYRRLLTLSVSDCQATREKDKELILAKIGDKKAFDARLQVVIFGDKGLLRHRFKGFEKLDAAVLTLRRAKILKASSFES